MDLVVDQVVELQDVHVAHRDRRRERLAGTAVEQLRLAGRVDQAHTVARLQRHVEETCDLLLARTVEHRGRDLGARGRLEGVLRQLGRPLRVALDLPALLGDPPEVGLQHLAEVHSTGDAERVQDDVDRSSVREERHVLDREDLRDDALVAVTAGELVALGDLALLGDVDHDATVDTRAELVVAVFGVELLDGDDRALLAVRNLQRRVANLAALLVEDRAQQALLGRKLGLALRRDLADEDVAGADLGADADDAALVEILQELRADVGEVTGDLLLAELRIAGVHLVLLDVDRGEGVVLDEVLAEDDRILEVVAFPRHERDEEVLTERQLAVLGGGSVGDDLADLDTLTCGDDDLLVVRRALVGAVELAQVVLLGTALVEHEDDAVCGDLGDDTGLLGGDHVTRVDGGVALHTGSDERRVAAQQRHGLTLHVRAHERALCIVVLEERHQRSRDRHHLARRDVHVADLFRVEQVDLAAGTAGEDAVLAEMPVLLQRSVGLSDDEVALLGCREVVDLVGDLTVDDATVRGLDEAEGVDARERRERTDQADVRAFRGLDRAHAAVVGRVDVTDLDTCAVTAQATGAEGGQAALVGQTRERVVLVHELRQLRRSEELLDRGDDGSHVDQGLRGDRFDVLRGHALADDALHAGQTSADLVLDQLADRADATVAEVVDVVGGETDLGLLTGADPLERLDTRVDAHEVLDRLDDVLDRQNRGGERCFQAELLVDLVTTDLREVVALRVEVEVVQQSTGSLGGDLLARTELAVDVAEGIFLRDDGVLGQGLLDGGEAGELDEDLLAGHAQRLEEHRDRLLALAVDAHADLVALVDLELEPCTTARDDASGDDVLVGRLVGSLVEVDTRRTHELRDDDALGAVDDERSLAGLQREVAHEDRLGLDLTREVVHELGLDVQRSGVGLATLLALLDRVLLRLEVRVRERQLHRLAEVLDRRDLLEDLAETRDLVDVVAAGLLGLGHPGLPVVVPDEPTEGFGLQSQKVWDRQGVGDLGERKTGSSASVLGGGGCGCVASSSQGNNLREPRRASDSFVVRWGCALECSTAADHHMRAGRSERNYQLYVRIHDMASSILDQLRMLR